MADAVTDVQTFLQGQGLVDGSTDWPSIRRKMHDESDRLVMIAEDGGPRPEMPASSGVGSAAVYMLGVLVTVRGLPDESDPAADQAEQIRRALHGERDVVIGSRTYIGAWAMTPHPVFAGWDENNRAIFTVAFRLEINETG